ncbi:hypothetical protein OIU78_018746 [Salix suchowensis]|nr:hypothetical protein OIU78_018746 [Salix suchowensis]
MKYNSFLRSPKKEEQEVPDTVVTQFSNVKEEAYGNGEIDVTDELEGIFGIEHDEMLSNDNMFGRLSWDFMDLEDTGKVIKEESIGFGDGDEKGVCLNLNLNLNYQEVMEAWSDRAPLLAADHSLPMASNDNYMGEVPVMEEDRTRREASVLRYKEKRQTRLFSKKIRYQVRKLNAEKRPRLKGRFVKRVLS